jgi:hypothetical protein
MIATCKDDVIAVFRDVQTGLIGAPEYTPEARYLMHQICEWLINGLKESNGRFWTVYRMWGADQPDLTDELMERVFTKLNIETIDPLSVLLT